MPKINKTIYVRDQYGVKRQAFVPGETVAQYVYDAILKNNTVVNPEDLPDQPKPAMETKELPLEEPEVEKKAPVKKVAKSKKKVKK